MTEASGVASVRSVYGSKVSVDARREAFVNGGVPVAVYGLGKMGLPLAAVFAETCGNVIGADIDPNVVDSIHAGRSHVKREPGLEGLISELVADAALTATSELHEAAEQASIHVVIVPTPITEDNEPDLAILDAVTEAIGVGLSTDDLVLIESTVPPQTTERRVLPVLEKYSGLSAGEFGLAFCPERTASGRALQDIRGAYPKVVGGVDDRSTEAARLVYEEINNCGVLTVSDATIAEAVKVFEGLYRDVNIALANELAQATDELGIDVREAIDTANTQPFCDIHDPGAGVGGHCIPFYPYFLIDPFDSPTKLLETAREVNDSMPSFTVEKAKEGLEAAGKSLDESTVLILGLTYRPGVEEIRASPSIAISEELSDEGATVFGVDPVLDEFSEFALEPIDLEEIYKFDPDAVLLVTPHQEFEEVRWNELESAVIVDGRDALDVDELDGHVYTIGSGEHV